MVEPSPQAPSPPSRPGRRLGLRLALSALITGAIIAFLLRYARWSDVTQLLSRANPWLLTVPPTLALMYLVRAFAFRLLAPATPLSALWSIMTVHNFMLRVLPMRSGELSYAFLMRRKVGVELGSSLIGLLLIRLLDATAIVVIFAGTLLSHRQIYRGDASAGLAIAVGGIALGLGLVALLRPLLALGVALLAAGARVIGLGRRASVARFLQRLGRSVDAYARYGFGLVLAQACLAAVVWLLNFLMVYQILRGVGVDASFAQAVLGSTAATLSSILPVGGIGSFGALEAGWVIGFSLVGLPRGVAVASALGYSLYTFLIMGVFSLWGWVWSMRTGR